MSGVGCYLGDAVIVPGVWGGGCSDVGCRMSFAVVISSCEALQLCHRSRGDAFARGCGCRGDIVLRCIAAVSLLAGEMFLRADVVALLILSVMRCSIVVVVHGGGASLCVAFVETDGCE